MSLRKKMAVATIDLLIKELELIRWCLGGWEEEPVAPEPSTPDTDDPSVIEDDSGGG